MVRTRREFLKSAAAAGATINLVAGASTKPQAGPVDGLPRRVLGRTKESVTLLGLGCAYAGSGVSEVQTRASLEAALEGGVRYFDAAPEYEQAEIRLGPVVKPIRDRVFLVTKSYAVDAKEAERDLLTALRQLRTDHVDLFLQHGVGLRTVSDTQRICGKGGSLEYLCEARKKGLARFIGMSVHPPFSTALDLLARSQEWDVIMPFLNYVTVAR